MSETNLKMNFRPLFKASEVGLLTNSPSLKIEFECLVRFQPFSNLRLDKAIYEKVSKKIIDDYADKWTLSEQNFVYLSKYLEMAKSRVFMERGTQYEPFVIQKVNREKNYNFVPDKKYRIASFDLFQIGGIIDGIDKERDLLIEVKTKSFLKEQVSCAEKHQCMVYMKLTGCKNCLLVENSSSGEQRISSIEWDKVEFEKKIIQPLNVFVEKYKNAGNVEALVKNYKEFE